jgi:hypothetical protein
LAAGQLLRNNLYLYVYSYHNQFYSTLITAVPNCKATEILTVFFEMPFLKCNLQTSGKFLHDTDMKVKCPLLERCPLGKVQLYGSETLQDPLLFMCPVLLHN